ncbi:MAG: M48 family metallopeptidase [Deltaproteobacteria bacterium]|nr:M48 family metallopeptidase [Deltaproteobacteria bacterium]
MLICFLVLSIWLPACSAKRQTSAEDSFREASLKTNALVQRYGQIVGSEQTDYLASLERRLRTALPENYKREKPFKVILIDTGKPLAYSPGAGFIIISRGMVRALGNEAQLVFVLAHEMAHYYLKHNFIASERDELFSPEQELAADKLAVGIMALAGWDPMQALTAIRNIYKEARPFLLEHGTHPDPSARTAAIRQEMHESGWRSASLTDRRDFRKFKMSL